MGWSSAFAVVLAFWSCTQKKASIVVGVQSEPMGGTISSMRILVRVDGAVVHDEMLLPPLRSPLSFPRPWEARFRGGGGGDSVIDVQVDAFDAARPETPLIRRQASTRFVPGRETLLRIGLEARCIVYPSPPRPPGSPPGPLNGPTCHGAETCIRGVCQSDVVPSDKLEPYEARWATHTPDLCKPQDGGVPTLEVGTGETAFSAVTRGQMLRAEPGPQGGHHIWIAVRSQNVAQRGATTTISAVQSDTGTAIAASVFQFPFDPAGAGSCQLYGLRYQLDNGGIDYTQFLGKPLDVSVSVIDASGARATASAHIEVAPDLALGSEPALPHRSAADR